MINDSIHFQKLVQERRQVKAEHDKSFKVYQGIRKEWEDTLVLLRVTVPTLTLKIGDLRKKKEKLVKQVEEHRNRSLNLLKDYCAIDEQVKELELLNNWKASNFEANLPKGAETTPAGLYPPLKQTQITQPQLPFAQDSGDEETWNLMPYQE